MLCAGSLFAQSNKLLFAPVPDWVQPCEWTASAQHTKNDASEGTRYLLYERQEHPQREETFTRIILQMENETGVQDSGSLTFSFDPNFQELILHRVRIFRGGQALDRLDRSKVKIIQPEWGLNQHMVTGQQQALLFVEDLRVGDALEYAYTTRGQNPIINGHYSTRFVVQSYTPVERERFRVVWTFPRPLHQRQHLAEAGPLIRHSGEAVEYLWDYTNLTAISFEDYAPPSYEPLPYLELSDFDDWGSVVEWALPLYSIKDVVLPAELLDLIAQWQTNAVSVEEKARRALQFVQDDLRYTALELGPDSYRPAPPEETFQKRFGDCKAKVVLLCAILKALNVEAYPALVNTWTREAIARRLPSPFAFDHVIAQLVLDGKTIWVDPTRSYQGGLLENRFLPPLGCALVVREGVKTLETIPRFQRNDVQKVVSTFRMSDYDSPVAFTVKSIYRGGKADSIREQFARTDRRELQKEYLNFYSRYYPGVEEARPLEFLDQREGNVLTVTEFYRITDHWKLNENEKRLEAWFYADSLQHILTKPAARLRKMPLSISYPLHCQQEIVIHLPDAGWDIPPLDKEVANDVFTFRYQRRSDARMVRFNYGCETHTPEVPAEKVSAYLSELTKMENLLDDMLYRPASTGSFLSRLNWLMVVVVAFGLFVSLAGSIWLWHSTRAPAAPPAPGDAGLPPVIPTHPQLQGLGGWLILVGIGLCIAPLWRVGFIAQHWEAYFSLHVWQQVAMPQGESYSPWYGPTLVFELLGNTLLLGLNVFLIFLFFGKRRLFPKAYICLLFSGALFVLLDEIATRQITTLATQDNASFPRELLRAIGAAFIWTSYMLKSKRVKATFVR